MISLLNKINILFFLVGIAIGLYFYIGFAPTTSKYFVNLDVEYGKMGYFETKKNFKTKKKKNDSKHISYITVPKQFCL